MTNTLTWTTSENGHAQTAASTVATDTGQELAWFLAGGRLDHWGLSLAPEHRAHVWHRVVVGSEDDAKAVAAEFERTNGGTRVRFPYVDVLERYHLVGGGTVTAVVATRPEPLHIGELNSFFAGPAAKRLRKAKRGGKVLRVVAERGVAIMPAEMISFVGVLQRHDSGEEFLGEPGWPPFINAQVAAEGADAKNRVDRVVDLAVEYGDKRAVLSVPGAGPAEHKAAEGALAHLRAHVKELVDD